MKKSATLLTVVLLATLLFAGCDLFSNVAFDDIAGEWTFPSLTQISGNAIHEAHLSILGTSESAVMLDISWYAGSDASDDSNQLFYMANGSMDGNSFTGSYTSNALEDPPFTLTVKFSVSNDKIKMEATGTGPLNGLTMTGGELQVL